jgi:hypothetical protein
MRVNAERAIPSNMPSQRSTSVSPPFVVTDIAIPQLTDVSGKMACAKKTATGKYKWSYADNAITFTKVDDDCSDRSGDLIAQPWKKQ